MKFLNWRPSKLSRPALALIALTSVALLVVVQRSPRTLHQPWYKEKLAAAQTAAEGMQVIRLERLARGHQFDPQYDPALSGMVGDVESVTTSNSGDLESKQTSVNPNFAAVAVELLRQAGVGSGDRVAVGYTGSFPSMNLCVLAALQALDCQPVIIASATASQYGANRPDLLWIDMERLLNDSGVITLHSHAISMGGAEDRALRLSDEAREIIHAAINRSGLPFIDEPTYDDSLEKRMALYEQFAGGEPFKAYINVGSGSVSVGRARGMKYYEPGLNLKPPPGATQIDSVMSRFASQGIPVLHFVEIKQLARAHGLPIAPTQTPVAGDSPVHVQYEGNRLLAAVAIGLILLATYLVILRGRGLSLASPARLFGRGDAAANEETRPNLELMV